MTPSPPPPPGAPSNTGAADVPDALARELSALTASAGAGDALARAAWEQEHTPRGTRWAVGSFGSPVRGPVAAALAAAVLLIAVIGVLLPGLGKARSSSRAIQEQYALSVESAPTTGVPPPTASVPGTPALNSASDATTAFVDSIAPAPALEAASEAVSASEEAAAPAALASKQADPAGAGEMARRARSEAETGGPRRDRPAPPALRAVIRTASMELAVKDVDSAYAQIRALAVDGLGEYVERAALDASGGTLTLRVLNDRLESVIEAIRAIAGPGGVVGERGSGEDVTDRVVDLEARLRNEQRIERELLDLLDKRGDAPLREVLDLRAEIDRVRGSIEQLIGQRERLARSTALATLVVSVRPAGEPVKDEPSSMWGDAGRRLGRAWKAGLDGLISIGELIVVVAVGGIPIWIAGGAVGLVAWRIARRRARRAADEQAPTE